MRPLRIFLIGLSVGLVAILWLHRGVVESGERGVLAQMSWLSGNTPEKLTTPVPRAAALAPAVSSGDRHGFNILNTSREQAEIESATLFRYIESKPQEALLAEARRIAPSFIDNTEQDIRAVFDEAGLTVEPSFIEKLKMHRAMVTVARYTLDDNKARFGTYSVAGWEMERRFQTLLESGLSEEQFQVLTGLAKWQFQEKPHPYGDIDGAYWPQSEAFSVLTIDSSIKTEPDLYKEVPLETVARVIDIWKDFELTKTRLLIQNNEGALGDDEWKKLSADNLDVLYATLRGLLTKRQAILVGFADIYEEPSAGE